MHFLARLLGHLENRGELVARDRRVVGADDVLVREMPRFLDSRFIAQEDLRAGRWREAINTDAFPGDAAPFSVGNVVKGIASFVLGLRDAAAQGSRVDVRAQRAR